MDLSASSSSFSYEFNYDVFLSFRGTDTRYGFTGNLYKALCDKGIRTFIDDEELQRGDEITPSLVKAIEESRIAITVLSDNYASSSFCLDELSNIIHSIKGKGRLVLPVFYDVDPSDVRHQRGTYGEALASHEERYFNENKEKVHNWRNALHSTANLSGFHFKHGDGYEYEFIGRIVKEVSNKINRVPLHVVDYPVGLESRVLHVKSLLDVGYDDGVHMVGIYGIGGIGKTTLARAVYNLIADQFDGLCFLHDVRENSVKHGLEHLQETLLSKIVQLNIKIGDVNEGVPIIRQRLCQKKVLLVLDDVDGLKQLHAIVGRPDWFGPGSRVIITTRNSQLLACHDVKRTYEVKELNQKDALELLQWKAFKTDKVSPSYVDVINRAITHASGLPLALEVIGSNLFGKSIEEWKSALCLYERVPNAEIQKVLKVSFDALEKEEKGVFLDIACCFKGFGLMEVENILHAHHGHCMTYHLGVLVEKSLINIKYGVLTLHDLIEDMGKEIVRQESPKEPGKRSRLWFHEDIVQVLEDNTGTSNIEIIYLDFPNFEDLVKWDGKAFKKMIGLKTLIILNGQFSEGPKQFPNSLRVLEWWGFPSQSLPSNFHPRRLAILRCLNFLCCKFIKEIPDVSGVPNLEEISLANCGNLTKIHESVGFLDKLRILNAFGCDKLRSFPPCIKLTSLEVLNLSCCKSLESFPEVLGEMEKITMLWFYDTPIKNFPFSIRNLIRLQKVELVPCRLGQIELSSSICMSPELEELEVRHCKGLQLSEQDDSEEKLSSNVKMLCLKGCMMSNESLQIGLAWFANVKELDLSKSNFTILPACIKEFHFLRKLYLDNCNNLQEIGGIPPNLEILSAKNCTSLTSQCRSMFMNKEMHEAGGKKFCLPATNIPEWFEHQRRRLPISFWFRNKFPAISLFLVAELTPHLQLILNGEKYEPFIIPSRSKGVPNDHIVISDLKRLFFDEDEDEDEGEDEMLLENEWNHLVLSIDIDHEFERKPINPVLSLHIGFHVFKEKSSMEDIRFNDPYISMLLGEKHRLDTLVSEMHTSSTTSVPDTDSGRKFVGPLIETHQEPVVTRTYEDHDRELMLLKKGKRKLDENGNLALESCTVAPTEAENSFQSLLQDTLEFLSRYYDGSEITQEELPLLLQPRHSALMKDTLEYLLSLRTDAVSHGKNIEILELLEIFAQLSLDYKNARLKCELTAAVLSKAKKVKKDIEANVEDLGEVETLENYFNNQLACLQERNGELEEQIKDIKAEISYLTQDTDAIASNKRLPQAESDDWSNQVTRLKVELDLAEETQANIEEDWFQYGEYLIDIMYSESESESESETCETCECESESMMAKFWRPNTLFILILNFLLMDVSLSSSSFSYEFNYDVFLSFRGTDTRYGFTGNLYKALCDKGIRTFIDDEELQRGDEITPSLVKAIEESRIAIIVLSDNYASSSFCLDELSNIIHSIKGKGRLVLPVFYDVDPSDVRHQRGTYGEALASHEERFNENKEKVHHWRKSLHLAANLSGFRFKHGYPLRPFSLIYLDGYEYEFIGRIVKEVSNKINRVPLHVADYPVGLESRVLHVKSLLDVGSDDGVHMVGIYGIGGIGKTTLARAVYNLIADQFDGLCFLRDVRENSVKHGLEHLQETLLSKVVKLNIKIGDVNEGVPIIRQRLCQKKVLLVLDDVDGLKQLHAIVGRPDWFGPGSRVIITTRNSQLLACLDVKRTYEVKELNQKDALELLQWKAFKIDKVSPSYVDVINRAVTHASGLPLALEVIGSNLFGKSIEEWKSALCLYERVPNAEIQKVLKVSFDALEEEEKSVFLDIACCFKGFELVEVENILHAHHGHCMTYHLGVLVEKSLINIMCGVLTLHDLIEDMGKEIVRQESPKEPGKRSRLWFHEDIVQVLEDNMKFVNLRDLSFEGCKFIKEIPDVSGVPNLEEISVRQCDNLIKIHESVGFLDKLRILDAWGCDELRSFPPCIKLTSLEVLELSHCKSLESFPEVLGEMEKITEFFLFGTPIKKFPFSIRNLTRLQKVELFRCGLGQIELSSSIFMSPELEELEVSQCERLQLSEQDVSEEKLSSNVKILRLNECMMSDESLQRGLSWFANVKELDLSQSNFTILPACIKEFHFLRKLCLDDCNNLEEIGGIPPNMEILSAKNCTSLTSQCRSMLMNKELHEAGGKMFYLPATNVPEWFEHQRRRLPISLWFRNKFPAISLFLNAELDPHIQLIVNGKKYRPFINHSRSVHYPNDHIVISDLKQTFFNDFPFDFLFLLHEWNHLVLSIYIDHEFGRKPNRSLMEQTLFYVLDGLGSTEDIRFNDPYISMSISPLLSLHIGFHIFKEKTSMKDIRFNDPYISMLLGEKHRLDTLVAQMKTSSTNSVRDTDSSRKFLCPLIETPQEPVVTSAHEDHDRELMLLKKGKGKLDENGNLALESSTIAPTEAETSFLSHLLDTREFLFRCCDKIQEVRMFKKNIKIKTQEALPLLLQPRHSALMKDTLDYLLSLPMDAVSHTKKIVILELSELFAQLSLDYKNARLKHELTAAVLSKANKVKKDIEANVKDLGEVETLENYFNNQLACLQEKNGELEEQIKDIKAEIVYLTQETDAIVSNKRLPEAESDDLSAAESDDLSAAESDDLSEAESDDLSAAESDDLSAAESDDLCEAESDDLCEAESDDLSAAESDDLSEAESDDLSKAESDDLRNQVTRLKVELVRAEETQANIEADWFRFGKYLIDMIMIEWVSKPVTCERETCVLGGGSD
ncbi:uncharacterized protein LOC133313561 [Gastrolobium bilobum]|uniref:uncharacterized protein LOC133313561 n=1 Tax=Gastrolobium bilobum TaxID=150636 RepID=UPI002AAF7A14|nr:uncharacterized protein LOC133313561 [Gastrolobium bilobum]